jgi:hypothetical protein
LLLSNAVTLRRDLSIIFNRIAITALIYCIIQDIVSLSIINKGLGLHESLLHISNITPIIYTVIYLINILILQLTSFYPSLIRKFKFFLFKELINYYSKFYNNKLGEDLNKIEYSINNYIIRCVEYYFNIIDFDSILYFLVININLFTNKINCMIPFSFSFFFFLLYKGEAGAEVFNI